eukprot:3890332-Rhodomonas_salina.1
MSGTDRASYALAMQCPVLTEPIRMSGTDRAYHPTCMLRAVRYLHMGHHVLSGDAREGGRHACSRFPPLFAHVCAIYGRNSDIYGRNSDMQTDIFPPCRDTC